MIDKKEEKMEGFYLIPNSAENVDPNLSVSLKGYNILTLGQHLAGYETQNPCAYIWARVRGHGTTHIRPAHAYWLLYMIIQTTNYD